MFRLVCPLLAGLLLVACGSDDSGSATTPGTGGTAGGTAGTAGVGGGPGGAAGSSGSGGAAGIGGVGGVGGVGPSGPVPTADEVQFAPLNALPSGEQLLFNDWDSQPNKVRTMLPDGSQVMDVFEVYRVWSMTMSADGGRLAFSSADPFQEQRHGVTIGDAIQNTWMYDAVAETVQLLSPGNLNDECHVFGPGDTSLYLCRRYDFAAGVQAKGYRIGRLDLATSEFSFLTPEEPLVLTLLPQPTADEMTMFFHRITIANSTQTSDIMKMGLPSGMPELVRGNAGRPVLSPDGTRYLYADYADGRALYASKLDGSEAVKLTSVAGTEPSWSPDGSRIAYLSDSGTGCAHVDIVQADGSTVDAPNRVRDCSTTGEFITELLWVSR